MSEFLSCIVGIVLIRESLPDEDREAFVTAAREYVAMQRSHQDVIGAIEREAGHPEHGLRLAGVRSDFAAHVLLDIFENRSMPTKQDTHVLGNDRPDYFMATAMQHTYDLLGWETRLSMKAHLRKLVKVAAEPLDAEVSYILDLLNSWEAWELEQQLDS